MIDDRWVPGIPRGVPGIPGGLPWSPGEVPGMHGGASWTPKGLGDPNWPRGSQWASGAPMGPRGFHKRKEKLSSRRCGFPLYSVFLRWVYKTAHIEMYSHKFIIYMYMFRFDLYLLLNLYLYIYICMYVC